MFVCYVVLYHGCAAGLDRAARSSTYLTGLSINTVCNFSPVAIPETKKRRKKGDRTEIAKMSRQIFELFC